MVTPLNSAEGVLVRVKNKLSLALGINTQTLRLLIDSFISIKHGKAYTRSHFDKTNTFGELTTDKMTIKVFFKYLKIIRVKKITIAITVVTDRDREVTIKEDIMMSVHTPQGETDD